MYHVEQHQQLQTGTDLLTLHGQRASLGGQLEDLIISRIHTCAINVTDLTLHHSLHYLLH